MSLSSLDDLRCCPDHPHQWLAGGWARRSSRVVFPQVSMPQVMASVMSLQQKWAAEEQPTFEGEVASLLPQPRWLLIPA